MDIGRRNAFKTLAGAPLAAATAPQVLARSGEIPMARLNDCDIHYRVAGAGPTVVLLHGPTRRRRHRGERSLRCRGSRKYALRPNTKLLNAWTEEPLRRNTSPPVVLRWVRPCWSRKPAISVWRGRRVRCFAS